jgi:heptosyltransferase-2
MNSESIWLRTGLAPIALGACSKILVVKLDAIGDFILATPFLRGLRAATPDAEIDLLVTPQALPLAEPCPFVNRVVGCETVRAVVKQPDGTTGQSASMKLSGSAGSCDGFQSNYAKQLYDLAVVPRWDYDLHLAWNICVGSGARRRVGFSVPLAAAHLGYDAQDKLTDIIHRPFAAHDVEHNAALLGYLISEQGAQRKADAGPVALWVRGQDMAVAERLLQGLALDWSRPVVAVCPGATGINRRMPASKLLVILKRVQALVGGVQFIVLGSASEAGSAATLCANLACCKDLCGRTSLLEVTALISRVTAVVGMDSGPAHIAAATDTPVVVFSPHPQKGDPNDGHSPVRFRPWGQAESIVLQPEEPVWPCVLRCRAEGPNCILAIPDEVGAQTIRGVIMRAMERDTLLREQGRNSKALHDSGATFGSSQPNAVGETYERVQ